MKQCLPFIICFFVIFNSCSGRIDKGGSLNDVESEQIQDKEYDKEPEAPKPISITLEKDFSYDKYTLEDEYPYKDTTRVFQWDKIKDGLKLLSEVQRKPVPWAVLKNRKNVNGVAPAARNIKKNAYGNFQDRFGVEKYQSTPLYLPNDLKTPERYGRDGTLVRLIGEINDSTEYAKVSAVYFEGEWMVPVKYIQVLDTIIINKVIFVDRTNQNIATLEQTDNFKWLIRSMNKATTGAHRPPYQHETPLGIFVIQEKKPKMYYLVDGTQNIAGYAPHASRFSNGGYVHGIPVNKPRTAEIETSATLGTIPRSHMCVRNVTSHAKFVYDWAPIGKSLVYVIE